MTDSASNSDGAPYWVAFLASVGAGLATSIGAFLAVRFGSTHNPRFLAMGMALAAGVMIYVSLAEIYGESVEELEKYFGTKVKASALSTSMFFIGAAVTWGLDKIVHRLYESIGMPDAHGHMLPDPERATKLAEVDLKPNEFTAKSNLITTAIITGLAMAIHNFPEGLTSFIGLVQNGGSGIPLVVAIGVHNIPEGICVAVPILYATGSKMKAFLWGTLPGLTEPFGAAMAWVLFANTEPQSLGLAHGILFAAVSGMMTYISFAELLPTALKYEPKQGNVAIAVFFGMFIMGFSIVMFEL